MTRGVNLPGFRATQLDFAAHVRNPDANPVPTDVESRRMAIYVELVFNNIDKFLSTTFRVTAAILGPDRWRARVRDFIDRHTSTTPFFQEIPQEFLAYLDAEGRQEDDPPFLLELAHYEWVELAVDLDDAEIESEENNPCHRAKRSNVIVVAFAQVLRDGIDPRFPEIRDEDERAEQHRRDRADPIEVSD